MKVVILAGGIGTRISEETQVKPKPMVEVGGQPLLWHIMKIYSAYGLNEFVVCLGYKGYVIKEFFANYFIHSSDVTFDLASNKMEVHQQFAEPWRVTLVDTGEATQTGGRLKRVQSYLNGEDFCFTYGDGLSNVNIRELTEFHRSQGTLATVTAVQPPGRFGVMRLDGRRIAAFRKSPEAMAVGSTEASSCCLPARSITSKGTIRRGSAHRWRCSRPKASCQRFCHNGFWQPMDHLRDHLHSRGFGQVGQGPLEGVVVNPASGVAAACFITGSLDSRDPGWPCG